MLSVSKRDLHEVGFAQRDAMRSRKKKPMKPMKVKSKCLKRSLPICFGSTVIQIVQTCYSETISVHPAINPLYWGDIFLFELAAAFASIKAETSF